MLRGWENVGISEVLESFARAVRSRLIRLDSIVAKRDAFTEIFKPSNTPPFQDLVASDEGKRRRVVEALVTLAVNEPDNIRWLDTYRNPFLSREDFFWMIDQLLAATSTDRQAVLARLIRRLFDADPDQVQMMDSARRQSPVLAEAFSSEFRVIKLDSDEARLLRDEYREFQEMQAREKSPTLLDPTPAERIDQLLKICESGNSAAWEELSEVLTLEPNSTRWGNLYEDDVTTLPGWKAADDATKARIIEVARNYLAEQDPAPREWLGRNVVSSVAMAGYKALVLLLHEDQSSLESMAGEVWAKWTPVILEHSHSIGEEGKETADQKANQELVRLACQSSREAIIGGVLLLIEYDYRRLDRVEGCWDDALTAALLNKLEDRDLKPSTMGHILRHLLRHDVVEAKAFAEALVALPLPVDEDGRERAIVAAYVLMTQAREVGWEAVWPAIQQDDEFGRRLIAGIASAERPNKSIGEKLNEEQLADFYVWLVGQFPYRAADDRVGYGSAPTTSPTLLRDSLLRQLVERGTPQACRTIQGIMAQLPDLDWMKWHLQEAQAIARRRTWVPPRPKDVLELSAGVQRRLVQNEEQLLEAVIDSLKRLESKLQGETPAVFDLWNEVKWHQLKKLVSAIQKRITPKKRESKPGPKNFWEELTRKELNRKVYVPKEESALSNYVKRHLEEDLRDRGIIVNREVEIRPAERTDIQVDAVTERSAFGYDRITLIIEVKGCWNEKLDSAMGNQLANRYLRNNPGRCGLYLVGWFNCDLWDKTDYRKRNCPQLTLEEAQERYAQQATGLSQADVQVRALVLNTALPASSE